MISLAVERTEEEDAMEQLLIEDGAFMTAVIECRDQLITMEKSLSNVNSPSENSSAVTEEMYSRMEN